MPARRLALVLVAVAALFGPAAATPQGPAGTSVTTFVITGRGWGNLQQKPVLRPMVEEWLRGEHGQRLGVLGYRVTARGGALLLELKGAHSEHDHP